MIRISMFHRIIYFLAILMALGAQAQSDMPENGSVEADYHPARVIVKLDGRLGANQYQQYRTRQDISISRITGRHQLRKARPLFQHAHRAFAEAELNGSASAGKRSANTSVNTDPELLSFYVFDLAESQDIASVLALLEQDSEVASAQPDYVYKLSLAPNDYFAQPSTPNNAECSPALPFMWGAEKIKSPGANDLSLGEGVVVALVDSGVDYNHEDLRNNIWVNPGEIPGDGNDNDGNGYIDDVRGWDFVNFDNDPLDDHYHGTLLAGIMAATMNNFIGIYGIAPAARIMALKAAEVDGSVYSSTAASAIQYAVAKGAKVITLAYSRYSPLVSDPPMETAIRDAYNNGRVVVVPAGNANSDVSQYSPQNMTEPIVVAGTTSFDYRFWLSNYGVTVDVCAPSEYILTTRNTSLAGISLRHTVGDRYFRAPSGTSVAAAHASGLAALILARNASLTPAQVEQAMKNGGAAPQPDAARPIGNRIDALTTLTSFVPPLNHAAISRVSFLNDQLTVAAVLRQPSMMSCQLSWKKSSDSSWTLLPAVMPVVSGSEFTAGIVNLSAVQEAVVNLRLTCGSYAHSLSFQLERLLDPGFYDKTGQRVNLLGNDIYDLKVAALAGSHWTGLQLEHRLPGETAWRSGGIIQQAPLGADLSHATLLSLDSSVLPAGRVRFRLSVSANPGGTAFTVSNEFFVDAEPSLRRGFPVYSLAMITDEQPLATDIDGDQEREILVETSNWSGGTPGLQILHADGVESASTLRYCGYGASPGISAANLDGISGNEVLVAGLNAFHAYNGTGSALADMASWPVAEEAGFWTKPPALVADLDFDGIKEIITTRSANDSILSIYEPSGVKRSEFSVPYPANGGYIPGLALIDLDNDFQKEIIVCTQTRTTAAPILQAFRPIGAEYLGPGWPVDIVTLSQGSSGLTPWASALATGDIDGDGVDEIVFTTERREVFAIEKDGVVKPGFPIRLNTTTHQPPAVIALGNIDGAPGAEIVVPNDNLVNVFGSSGSSIPGWPQRINATLFSFIRESNTPIIADIDGDNSQEVIVVATRDSWGQPYSPTLNPGKFLMAWSSAGIPVGQWNVHATYNNLRDTGPVLTDLDNDGDLELIQIGRSYRTSTMGRLGPYTGQGEDLARIYAWELPGSSSGSPRDWPMFRADSGRTSHFIKYGDTSADGEVSAFDASRAAQAAVGLRTFISEERDRGDVSGDGAVTAFDAALIARRSVALLNRFPVEE